MASVPLNRLALAAFKEHCMERAALEEQIEELYAKVEALDTRMFEKIVRLQGVDPTKAWGIRDEFHAEFDVVLLHSVPDSPEVEETLDDTDEPPPPERPVLRN